MENEEAKVEPVQALTVEEVKAKVEAIKADPSADDKDHLEYLGREVGIELDTDQNLKIVRTMDGVKVYGIENI